MNNITNIYTNDSIISELNEAIDISSSKKQLPISTLEVT